MPSKFQVRRHPKPLDRVLFVRLTEQEHAKIKEAANACEQTINAWAREQLVFVVNQANEDQAE